MSVRIDESRIPGHSVCRAEQPLMGFADPLNPSYVLLLRGEHRGGDGLPGQTRHGRMNVDRICSRVSGLSTRELSRDEPDVTHTN